MLPKVKKYDYDIALSFAGENREYVREVANILKNYRIRVFYDEFEEYTLWGNNLIEYLQNIYKERAKYTVMFISKYYAKKLWTNHERKAMQERAFIESKEYILPARFDYTEIPGLYSTISYIDLNTKTPYEFVKIVLQKINWQMKNRWFGIWEIESSFLLYNGTLNIINVYNESFNFTLDVYNGAHMGSLDGNARILSNNEAEYTAHLIFLQIDLARILSNNEAEYTSDESYNEKKCVIKFTKFNDIIHVHESFGCFSFHGARATFNGDYKIKKDIFYDIVELGDKLLSKLFNELKDEYFEDFLKCIGDIHYQDSLDSFDSKVISPGIAGLYTEYQSILMYTKNDIYGAFLHDDGKIYYFTSDNNFRSTKPKTIIKWLERFEKEIVNLN